VGDVGVAVDVVQLPALSLARIWICDDEPFAGSELIELRLTREPGRRLAKAMEGDEKRRPLGQMGWDVDELASDLAVAGRAEAGGARIAGGEPRGRAG
jgi:hypothetical protein